MSVLLTILTLCIRQTFSEAYNLIYVDSFYGHDYKKIGFWGLNINLSNTDNCCTGTFIYNWSNSFFGTNELEQYTCNGTDIIGSVMENELEPKAIITINSKNPTTSLYISSQTTIAPPFNSWLTFSNANQSICNDHDTNEDQVIGLWLGSCQRYYENCHIYYGCVDTKTNTPSTISIYNDSYDITSGTLQSADSGASGGLYDSKRDLLWYYTPNFDFDKTLIFSININGTNMKQYVIDNSVNTKSRPFTECHYSVYYDIYFCECGEQGFCNFNPNTHETQWLMDGTVMAFALIDNGTNTVFIDGDSNVYAADIMKPEWKQIGKLKLQEYSYNVPSDTDKLLAFNG